jgi:hypothetical protein
MTYILEQRSAENLQKSLKNRKKTIKHSNYGAKTASILLILQLFGVL